MRTSRHRRTSRQATYSIVHFVLQFSKILRTTSTLQVNTIMAEFLVDFAVLFLVPFTIWLLNGYVRVQSSRPSTKNISQVGTSSRPSVPSPNEETALLHNGSNMLEETYRRTPTHPPQLCPVHLRGEKPLSSSADTPTTYNSVDSGVDFSPPPSSSQDIAPHALVPPLSDALEAFPAPGEEEEEVWSASSLGAGASEEDSSEAGSSEQTKSKFFGEAVRARQPGSSEEQVLDEHVHKRHARAGPKGRARRRRYLQARMLEEMGMMEDGMSMQPGDNRIFRGPVAPQDLSPLDHHFPKHQPVLHGGGAVGGGGQRLRQLGTTSNYAALTSSRAHHYVPGVEDHARGGHLAHHAQHPGRDIIMAHLGGHQGVLGPQHLHRQFGPQGPREYGPGPHHLFPVLHGGGLGHQPSRGGTALAAAAPNNTVDPTAKRYLPRRTGSRPCSEEDMSRPSQ